MTRWLGGSSSVRVRRLVLILMDLALIYIAIQCAVALRYEQAATYYMRVLLNKGVIPVIILLYTVLLVAGGVYHMMWRYAGARELCG